tara:strand:+ start:644 stop:1180 length:537 start_codon:yes stop_codon:yes gene_type:complete
MGGTQSNVLEKLEEDGKNKKDKYRGLNEEEFKNRVNEAHEKKYLSTNFDELEKKFEAEMKNPGERKSPESLRKEKLQFYENLLMDEYERRHGGGVVNEEKIEEIVQNKIEKKEEELKEIKEQSLNAIILQKKESMNIKNKLVIFLFLSILTSLIYYMSKKTKLTKLVKRNFPRLKKIL